MATRMTPGKPAIDPTQRKGSEEILDPRIVAQMSRLTGERVTYKMYDEGSTVTIRDRDF